MKWLIIVAGTAAASDPQAGERLLCGVILIACLIIVWAGPILVAVEHGRRGMYYPRWVLAVVATLSLAGFIGVGYVAVKQPVMQAIYPAVVISLGSLVSCLIAINFTEKKRK